jgi:hypothetical protein
MEQNGRIAKENVLYPIPSEIDIIEAALREAKRSPGVSGAQEFLGQAEALLGAAASPGPSNAQGSTSVPPGIVPGAGDAYSEADMANVIAYGNQLKSWVDIQVDCRMEAWLVARAEESVRTGYEVQAMKELQAKHFAVVESLSQEMLRIKSSVAAEDKAQLRDIDTLSKDLDKTTVAVEVLADDFGRLRKTVAFCESAIKDISIETKRAMRDVSLEHTQVESLEMRLRKRIEDNQNRLVAELRAETAAALQTESDAIARLDQRMWVLSQRVERRMSDGSSRVEREALAIRPITSLGLASSARILSRSLSPRESREAVYNPRWNIIGGRLISSEPDADDIRLRDNNFRSKLALTSSRMEEDSRRGERLRMA